MVEIEQFVWMSLQNVLLSGKKAIMNQYVLQYVYCASKNPLGYSEGINSSHTSWAVMDH